MMGPGGGRVGAKAGVCHGGAWGRRSGGGEGGIVWGPGREGAGGGEEGRWGLAPSPEMAPPTHGGHKHNHDGRRDDDFDVIVGILVFEEAVVNECECDGTSG